jgi:hypothetical protein
MAQEQSKIDALLRDARAKIAEAERIADVSGLTFEWNLEYGMGGQYVPAGVHRAERIAQEAANLKRRNPDAPDADIQRWAEDRVETSGCSMSGGWRSSSSDC